MPLISDATLHVGSSTVDAVYHGATQVWPTAGPATITHGSQIAADTTLVGPAAGGFTSLTTITGDYTVTTPNEIVSGKNITGCLFIDCAAATNVRVEGCRILGGIRHNGVPAGYDGTVITYCEVGPDTTYTSTGLGFAINPGFRELSYSNVHNGPDITWVDGSDIATLVVIEYNWFHDAEDPSDIDVHADIIQTAGSTGGGIVRGNFLDASKMWYNTAAPARLSMIANSAVIFGNNWSNGTITLTNNLLLGGNYTAQLYDANTTNNNFYVVTGNWFGSGTVVVSAGTQTYPVFGPLATGGSTSDRFTTWSDNHLAELVSGAWAITGTLAAP